MSSKIIDRHGKTLAFLAIWFVIVAYFGYRGGFVPPEGGLPLVLLGLGTTVLVVFTLAYRSLSIFRAYVLSLDKRFLILIHSWRMLGMGFFLVYYVGALPAVFAIPSAFGDAITAVWATILAYGLLVKKSNFSNQQIIAWNSFGLADFVMAMSLGVMVRTGGELSSFVNVSSDVLLTFPFVIIPAFLVQVFILTHIIIFLQLRNKR